MAKKTKKKARKKAKKKSKKTVKKKTKKRRVAKRRKPFTLQEKIARIRDRVPYIEPTGECKDSETEEVLFKFTEAQHVFETYRLECEAEGLIFRPYFAVGIMPAIIPVARGVALVAPFCLEDVKTREILVGWGTGMGNNGDWSGNTAGTRALKQFLLTTFQATWRDPEQMSRQEQKRTLRAEVLRELEHDGTLGRIEAVGELTNFFDKSLKGKKDGKNRGSKNTKSRSGRSHKKNRTGA